MGILLQHGDIVTFDIDITWGHCYSVGILLQCGDVMWTLLREDTFITWTCGYKHQQNNSIYPLHH